ncbi:MULTISPECIES: 50S ribosomal protein L25/general stress protein Ctc [Thioclava]|uniref:50S ribosomal protein L25/general stress protein Ctc n=1 Tax=Thioclava TaxID=285107 RepID=UPI00099652A4|nr:MULTISPECIES: 50S ribosomal protein L25/general stress protein Ctc [Thioclava]OOY21685.1 50S ribosomal protein L25/general stress protein Ctc [Thioclava sp. DLFJ5-1]OWY04279.1 50S ribosomal protein L25/general stress protein Ctc [Thioclava sp. IC9]OWY05791.1 50S ribosomal protein L25/general stress protein Ctc [Thioclava sp. F1Mire-8]OWY11086.1 50S ribosomal protein L25/general stress protein Ctc [Thioclava sp. F42-5]OWY13843.1 50S ribosomal protein L25/general stress protein Ctc [Thioclava
MAKEIETIEAVARTGTGKGAARQARREGLVPGIVYGDGKDPVAINLDYNRLITRLRKGRFMSTLFNLKMEGQEDVRVICRGVQKDVVKDLPTHVDFMRTHRNSRISLFVHVEFINHEKAPGLKRGGTLVAVRPEVELNVLAGDIPEQIVVDLEGKQIGDTIHISDVDLPKGAKPTIERDFVIANVAPPKGFGGGSSDEDEGEEASEEATEE